MQGLGEGGCFFIMGAAIISLFIPRLLGRVLVAAVRSISGLSILLFLSMLWGVRVLLGPSLLLARQEAPGVQVLAVVEGHVVDALDMRL